VSGPLILTRILVPVTTQDWPITLAAYFLFYTSATLEGTTPFNDILISLFYFAFSFGILFISRFSSEKSVFNQSLLKILYSKEKHSSLSCRKESAGS